MRSAHRLRLRQALGLPAEIPADFSMRFHNISVPTTDGGTLPGKWCVEVVSTAQAKAAGATHRVYLHCSCDRLIPAGRIGQHLRVH